MKKVALGEVCTARSSLVDPTREDLQDLPHVAPDSIERNTGRLLGYRRVREDGVTSGKYQFEAGDLLYSKIRPNLNKAVLVDFGGLCSADMYALKIDLRHAVPEYVGYALRSKMFLDYATTLSNRANIPKINRAQLMRFQMSLPPLDEQRRIATVLDQADAIRTKRRRILIHLDTLTQSIFHDMFGSVAVKASLRSLGVDFTSGKNVVADDRNVHPVNRVIKVSAISRGRFVPSEAKPMPSDYDPPKSHRLNRGDVLFGRASGSLDLLGATAVVDVDPEDLFLPDKVWRLNVKSDALVDSTYVLGVLRSSDARAFIRHNASGAAGVRNISKAKLLEYVAPVPGRDLQRVYARKMELVERQRATAMRAFVAADELFVSLQSRAFEGEL